MIQVIGNLVLLAVEGTTQSTRDSLFQILLDRLHDVVAHVRSKTLQVWSDLVKYEVFSMRLVLTV